MKTAGRANVDDHDETIGTPVIFVSEKSIPSAYMRRWARCWHEGMRYAPNTTGGPRGNYIDPQSDGHSAITDHQVICKPDSRSRLR